MGLRGNTLLAYVAGIIDGEGNIGLHKVGGCNEQPYSTLFTNKKTPSQIGYTISEEAENI